MPLKGKVITNTNKLTNNKTFTMARKNHKFTQKVNLHRF